MDCPPARGTRAPRLPLCAAVGWLLVLPAGAAAAPPPDSVAVTLPVVEVGALRGHDAMRDIPATTFVIPHDQLQRIGSGRIAAALATLPGLNGYRATGSGEPSVIDPRGFSASGESSYLKVLVDGQDVRDVENGNVDWDWLPTDAVDRVEVVQGSGAWLYGDGSEGGVVNLVRRDANPGWRPFATVSGGSFGLRGGNLSVADAGSNWSSGLRGGARHADGWRDRSEEDAYTAGASATLRPGPHAEFGLDAAWLDSRREDPGSLTLDQLRADPTQAETSTDYLHTRRLVLGAHLASAPAAVSRWRLAPYLRLERTDGIQTIFFTPESHPTAASTAGTELTWQHPLGRGARAWTADVGGQAERARLRADYRQPSDSQLETRTDGRRTSGAVFGGLRGPITPVITARLGLRLDAIRLGPLDRLGAASIGTRTVSQASPFVALSGTVGRTGTVYGSFGTGFRVPTLHQLYDARPFFDPSSQQTIFISNPDLEPQRSIGVELGARSDRADGSWAALSVYSVRVRDEIDFDLGRFSYANLGRSWHRGVEFGTWQRLPAKFAATLNGAWTPTTIVGGDNDGRQINGVPQGMAYGALSWAWQTHATVEAGVRYTGKQWLDKANQQVLPDFATAELALTARRGGVNATARVANLLDRRYADSGFIGALGDERFLPASGRRFSVAISLE